MRVGRFFVCRFTVIMSRDTLGGGKTTNFLAATTCKIKQTELLFQFFCVYAPALAIS